ncbi:hypothetical protein H5410_062451 [Solanum commersonii]|uniref:Uncharacterized protein n=1 Tax=Solanum commersonii TaxID=4109 RepID=A0A9J5WAX4_SOLCO|nr:hypothetical protein H5410_062451 [Solanum commersonii]
MDNQTQILVNKIYEKMQHVEQSIDDKSHKLFKIRDELASLSEQERMMQYEINQLSTDQAENMSEFLLLCEHLNTRPKRNSNSKGNITPNKVAGDVSLAPSAKNISTVSTDMPKPKTSDEEKSRAEEKSKDVISPKKKKNTSSAKAARIIFGKPENNTNRVPSGAKVFSSFHVGKQHPKEEEYLAFTRYIYNLFEETQLFEFGYLDRDYAKPDLQKLSKLPLQLISLVKNYAKGEGVYYRFFNISTENKDLQLYFPTINYLMVEKLKDFNVKATRVDKKLPHLNKKWIQTRRALGIKTLYFILKHFYNEDYKVIDHDHDQRKIKVQDIKGKILDIKLHRLKATEKTWKLACKFLDHKHSSPGDESE